jgi:hypothetical protein
MSDMGRDVVKHAMQAAFEPARWRLIAAVAAGFALVQACGGRAADVAEGEDEEATSEAGARAVLPARPVGTTSPPPRGQSVTPPPREGELCYSRSRIGESGLAEILPFLPDDAIDANNCLTSTYSGWLDGGGCNYDPRPAVVRGDRCCYLLDGSLPDCGR